MLLELFGASKEYHFRAHFGTPPNWVLSGNLIKFWKGLREMKKTICEIHGILPESSQPNGFLFPDRQSGRSG